MIRFYLLNATAAAVLTALGLTGILDAALTGPARWGVGGLTGLLVLALVLFATGYRAGTRWLAYKMTVFGLIGTVIGLQEGLANTTWSGDPTAIVGQVMAGMGLALFSTVCGLGYYVYLDLILRLYGHEGEGE